MESPGLPLCQKNTRTKNSLTNKRGCGFVRRIDDWLPIYDKSALKGFYMAIGSSGNQFKNAPVAGHCMAELIDACEKGQEHDSDPVKVKSVYTGLELNMGFYSRNREINPNSSFSVNG